ncbi:hypothetical protein [Sediminibacterium soli]|uniref:hypothetical protein n=1 Tax=Sediminibacterium soli TaxID=2698829 RepID=UPI00137AD4FD|nr:hypothetical protein [Sediminibacterium soli]NCI47437.1 hypothetical protein [Sediminibacterium soli]
MKQNTNNNHGRTFWDLIAEHPKMTFSFIIALLIAIVVLAMSKYSLKSSVITIEPSKSTLSQIPGSADTTKQKNTGYQINSEKAEGHIVKQERSKPKQSGTAVILSKDTVQRQIVNVTSNNQLGGITANQVTVGAVPRKVDYNEQSQLVSLLPEKNEKIKVTCIMGSSEAFEFANEIVDFLKSRGYTKVDGVNQAMYSKPVVGKFLNRDSAGVEIIIGSNTM